MSTTEQPARNGEQPEDAPSWHEHIINELRHPSRSTMIRIGIALVLVVVSLYTNRQFLVWGLIATLAVLVVPLSRARSLVTALAPYTAVWFIFTFLRSFADETRRAKTVHATASELERWIFNGELPTIWLQAEFYDPYNLHWWDFYLTFVHWSYFIIPHAVAAYLWWKRPARFWHYLRALSLLLTLGLALYFLLPSNPPWMAPDRFISGTVPYVERIMEPIAQQIGGGLYEAGYKVVGESNPIAAMPSIHMAVTFLLVMLAGDYGRPWRIAAWFYSVSMALALVYLGEHYVIDIIVGCLITAYSWHAAGSWMLRVVPFFRNTIARRSDKERDRRPVGSNV